MEQMQTPTSGAINGNGQNKVAQIQSGLNYELKDILADSQAGSDSGTRFFYRYKPQKEIAAKIGDVFFGKKYNNGRYKKYAKGFFNSDLDRSQVGLLTQCLGLQTAASLSQMDLDLSSYGENGACINDTINSVLASLGVTKEIAEKLASNSVDPYENPDLLSYRLSPYVSEDDENDDAGIVKSCVESASNVLKALVEIRESLYKQNDNGHGIALTFADKAIALEDMVAILQGVIRYTVGWLCGACIPAKKSENIQYKINGQIVYYEDEETKKVPAEKNRVKYLGWNFFRAPANNQEEYEPSLYMTYSVCSAYMSLSNSIREARAYDEAKVRTTEQENRMATKEGKRNFEFYQQIKKEFKMFRDQCIFAGRYEEMKCNGTIGGGEPIELTSRFIGQNYTSVSFEDIANSTTNDAIINTVFHVLILLYSGLDLDYEYVGKSAEFYDEMQYALQNVLRCYKLLNKRDKGYIIEQYVLSFKEVMPSAFTMAAKQLRRQRIQVASFLPTLIRAYNEVSRYLIKYPQKQNIEYLSLVLQNRSDNPKMDATNPKEWTWDREGYNLNSECYYVKAIVDFYSYYTTYEKPFLEPNDYIEKKTAYVQSTNEEILNARDAQHKEEMDKLQAQLDESAARVKELEGYVHPLVEEVKDVVRETVSQMFDQTLKATFVELLKEDDIEGSTRRAFNTLVLDTTLLGQKRGAGELDMSADKVYSIGKLFVQKETGLRFARYIQGEGSGGSQEKNEDGKLPDVKPKNK